MTSRKSPARFEKVVEYQSFAGIRFILFIFIAGAFYGKMFTGWWNFVSLALVLILFLLFKDTRKVHWRRIQ